MQGYFISRKLSRREVFLPHIKRNLALTPLHVIECLKDRIVPIANTGIREGAHDNPSVTSCPIQN